MPLTPGQTLASYEILALLGKGGMGEVYRASDPKLDRDVAIGSRRRRTRLKVTPRVGHVGRSSMRRVAVL